MKLTGLILVFLSSLGVGYMKAYSCKDGEKVLYSFIQLIYFINNEVASYLTPQNEIYEKFTNKTLEKNGFLKHLKELSSKGTELPLYNALITYDLKLGGEAKNILLNFAADFGTHSISQECLRCKKTISELEDIYQKTKEEIAEKSKLYKSIGGMVGMTIALLLW